MLTLRLRVSVTPQPDLITAVRMASSNMGTLCSKWSKMVGEHWKRSGDAKRKSERWAMGPRRSPSTHRWERGWEQQKSPPRGLRTQHPTKHHDQNVELGGENAPRMKDLLETGLDVGRGPFVRRAALAGRGRPEFESTAKITRFSIYIYIYIYLKARTKASLGKIIKRKVITITSIRAFGRNKGRSHSAGSARAQR